MKRIHFTREQVTKNLKKIAFKYKNQYIKSNSHKYYTFIR